MADSESKLLEEAARVAGDLPGSVLRDLAGRMAHLAGLPAGAEESALLAAVAPGPARDSVTKLFRHWRKQAPSLSPTALAAALIAAAVTHEDWRNRQYMELVWTGPAPTHSPLRRTEQVLVELVKGARERLLLVTYAAWRHPPLVKALEDAVARGVKVTILVDSLDPKTTGPKIDLVKALGPKIAVAAAVYEWSRGERPRDEGGYTGVLHVKCAVADGREVLISSANLTGHALELNMELGVRVLGGPVPSQVEGHFRELIEAGVFVPRATSPRQ